MDKDNLAKQNIITPELYFLISKFLTISPLQETAKVLVKELEEHKVLPKRIDWQGREHDQTYEELEKKYSHIGAQHLLEICCRIGPILDREIIPSVSGIHSLLGAGRQSLLRTKENICLPRPLRDYCTRVNAKPLFDGINRKSNVNNLVKVLFGRECSGPLVRRLTIPPNFYEKQQLLRRTLGHLSAVYCVLFDRTGKYIITGADDLLVKLWSAVDGRLLATFRGASAEITDIAINLDNTLLAAGSLDRIIRVWDLQTTGPIAVLLSHTGMITSVNFCPSPRGDLRYLVSTSTDGSVAFWQYTTQRGGKTGFASKPIQYHEKMRPGQAQMICASFSPGGQFLAAGSADHYVRVYIMSEDGPKRILETEAHSDTVDSIQWAHTGLRFISGGLDGTAYVWHFESQQWKSLKLSMSDRLPSCPKPDDESKKLKVTMVSWDYSDKWVITAVNDFTIKIWNAISGQLYRVLRGHTDELYVLESHPKDPNVLLSAGHDGQLILWDIVEGISVTKFQNQIEGQGHGGVFDAKWSPDGTMIAATDSHGHILVYGFGVGHERLKILPKELFFHTDYRPLIRDSNHYVLDEQTQTLPHLMPPPFLVDVDGNPHPPTLQRLVPGRENCPSDQLIPNIGLGVEPVVPEVVQEEGVRSDLDRLIEALANRQGQEQAPDSNNDRENQIQNRTLNNNSPRGGHRIALRRTGDVEGVRQGSGNWQRDGTFKFVRRIFVRPMRSSQLQTMKHSVYSAGLHEMDLYRREMRRRPVMITTSANSTLLPRRRGRLPKGVLPAYRTRAVREREPHVEEEQEPTHSESGSSSSDSDSSANEADLLMSGSSSSDSESSDYSDWVADDPGINLEPPKRSKRKPAQRRLYSPESDNAANRKPKNKKINISMNATPTGDIPEPYMPPEWLCEVIPGKAPYYPQMGDEVVYLRQGHQRYLEAVRNKDVYKLSNNSEPWTYVDLREHEICKVIGIKYEIRPPRLCCLKLGIIDRNGYLVGTSFTIKYHDMPDVLDFLVLRQTFDTAVSRSWSVGDRFRCMIGKGWWMGQIESRVALSPEFKNSLFMCFRVRWDNGEYEYMSPWDMEPIDENRLPDEIGGAVDVLPEELRATLYQPKTEEWPRGDREATCRRIINGFEQVMGLAIADPFLAPVDLNAYPQYAFVVEYPIDLSTIKARFENHFYRRITSAQFDVRYLATNAEKFNRPHSNIVKHARIITDLCLRIIRDPGDVDVGAVYHQLVDTYRSSESESENQPGPSTSTGGRRTTGSRRSKRLQSATDWKTDCRDLLEMMWQCDDSTPFREPVDLIEHPDYNQVIDTPMDLLTVKEDLLGGNYNSPLDFAKDMRLIFQNSRNYNTNKRSRIYSMTLRLSTLFETYIKPIILAWKTQRRRKDDKKSSKRPSRALTNGAAHSSDDDDDDDEDQDDGINRRTRYTRKKKSAKPSGSNAVSSSMTNEPMPGPSNPRPRGRPRLTNSQENNRSDSDSDTSPSSSSSDSDTEDSNAIPLAALGDSQKQRALAARRNRKDDSEDSYTPRKIANRKLGGGRIIRTGKRGRPRKIKKDNGMKREPPTTPKKQNRKRIASSDEDENEAPKKKSRKQISNRNESGGYQRRTQSQQRTNQKENEQTSDDNDSDDENFPGSSRKKARNRYESDHSYHLETRRPNESDSDDENLSRPTRAGTRRAQLNWGRDTDSLEDDNEAGLNSSKDSSSGRRRGRKSRNVEESRRNHPSTSRINRNRLLKTEEDSDNEPSNSGRTRRNLLRTSLTGTNTPATQNHRQLPTTSSSSSSLSAIRTATITSRNSRLASRIQTSEETLAPHEVDHNYGEPGPSSLRQNNRRILSRHQRNVDELDIEIDTDPLSLPQPSTSSSLSSRLRIRNNVNNSNSSNNSRNSTSTRKRTRQRFYNSDDDDDDDEEEGEEEREAPVDSDDNEEEVEEDDGNNEGEEEVEVEEFIGSRTRNKLNNRSTEDDDDDDGDDDGDEEDDIVAGADDVDEEEDEEVKGNDGNAHGVANSDDDEEDDDDDDENDSDPEDNKPLRSMVSSTRKSRLHNTRSGGVKKQQYYSDESQDPGPSGRSTRKLARLQYNEDSDDESGNTNNNIGPNSNGNNNNYRKRQILSPQMQNSSSNSPNILTNHHHNNNNNNNSNNHNMRNNRNHNNINDDNNSDNEQPVSISSRGRVRKITAKARGLFKE